MTRSELDAALALADRWSLYSLLWSLLFFVAGFALIAVGWFIVWGGHEIGTLLGLVGFCVCLIGLNAEPYRAR
jgi:hypothetical protein